MTRRTLDKKEVGAFPVKHYSKSSMVKFSENPILFKVQYINGDVFDTTQSISGIIGSAFHHAMEVYYGGSDTLIPENEAEAIEFGLRAGMDYLEKYQEGFIRYTQTIPNKQKAADLLVFAYNSYIKEIPYNPETIIGLEEKIEESVDVEWRGDRLTLPVPLKGFLDRIVREDGKLKIKDYKTTSAYSKEDKIDGAKMIEAVVYFLLAYARYGEAPYSMTWEEVKLSKNSDGSPQVRQYEVVYADYPLYFDFFFRFYEDMTRALNGEMVYVPNVRALYDNEVAMLAYIHRLDVDEDAAALMKKHQVTTVTELLKKQIQSAGNMRKLMASVEAQFVSAKNLNYQDMQTQEKIQTKMLEHGIMLQFDSVVEGATVDLYRYTPSIGVKMSRVGTFVADVEQVLGMSGVRVLAPITNSTMIGFEVPRQERQFPGVAPKADDLTIPIGVDINGATQYVNLREAPHMLIAGSSGSGKSVTINAILSSIMGNADLWLMDPKMVELANVPHERYSDSITGIMRLLDELTQVMESRYTLMKTDGAKTWSGRVIVAVIDEFADLVMQSKEGFEEWELCGMHQRYNDEHGGELMRLLKTSRRLRVREQEAVDNIVFCENCVKTVLPPATDMVVRLAQKSRAAGIHMILATQSPRVDIISGNIKANFPTRIALRTSSSKDSEVIIGVAGADKLLGKGDLLLQRSDSSELVRLQSFSS